MYASLLAFVFAFEAVACEIQIKVFSQPFPHLSSREAGPCHFSEVLCGHISTCLRFQQMGKGVGFVGAS